MLTVNFIGFFSVFRKSYIMAEALRFAAVFMALFLLGQPSQALGAQTAAGEEDGMIFYGRDEAGNRVFGTDQRAGAGFYTDPESGDRRFGTPPPAVAASNPDGDGAGYILVAPEVRLGSGRSAPGNDPGNRDICARHRLGPPPGGLPPICDQPPTRGGSFIPRGRVWGGSPR